MNDNLEDVNRPHVLTAVGENHHIVSFPASDKVDLYVDGKLTLDQEQDDLLNDVLLEISRKDTRITELEAALALTAGNEPKAVFKPGDVVVVRRNPDEIGYLWEEDADPEEILGIGSLDSVALGFGLTINCHEASEYHREIFHPVTGIAQGRGGEPYVVSKTSWPTRR